MTKTSKPLIFFGSGPVAAETLKFLSNNFDIDTVITKNRPAHHKEPAPVEEYAKSKSFNILYADNQKQLETLILDSKLTNQCGVIVDYGVIVSKKVIDYFNFGIINSHFSLLPDWRGADPISYSLLSGQIKTGVSLMLINTKLDDGPIIAQIDTPILKTDDSVSLTIKLIAASNGLLKNSIPKYLDGYISLKAQDIRPVTFSRKIDKKDGAIDWDKPATIIEREIRAFSTWPKSHCIIGDVEVVIIKARAIKGSIPAGRWNIESNRLLFGCRASVLEILELKPLGKNSMSAVSFINGYSSHLIH